MKRKGLEPLLTVYITTLDKSPNTCVQGHWHDMWRTSEELSTMYRMLKTPWYHGDVPFEIVRGSLLQRFNDLTPVHIQQDILDMIQEQCHAYQDALPTHANMMQQLRQRVRYRFEPFSKHITHALTTTYDNDNQVHHVAQLLVDYWTWRRGRSTNDLPGTYAVAATLAYSMFRKFNPVLPALSWMHRKTLRQILYKRHGTYHNPKLAHDMARLRTLALDIELCIFRRVCNVRYDTVFYEPTTYYTRIVAFHTRPKCIQFPSCMRWFGKSKWIMQCIEHDFVRWFQRQYHIEQCDYVTLRTPKDDVTRVSFSQHDLYQCWFQWLVDQMERDRDSLYQVRFKQYQWLHKRCVQKHRQRYHALFRYLLVNALASGLYAHDTLVEPRYVVFPKRLLTHHTIDDASAPVRVETAEQRIAREGYPLLQCADIARSAYIQRVTKRYKVDASKQSDVSINQS